VEKPDTIAGIKKALEKLTGGVKITLNGKPAWVTGWNAPFANVYDFNRRMSCEFSWDAVWNVITGPSKGAFFS
jgi:hypothetical protein